MDVRRTLMGASAMGLLLGGLVVQVSPASAATITVTTPDDELNSDGDCSLREAVAAANTDAVSDACAAGSGADVITIPAGTYAPSVSLVLSDADGVTLAGAGAASTTITGSGARRVIDVADGALTVTGLTLTGGEAGPDLGDQGGAIRSDDDPVEIVNAAVVDNHASHGGGIDTGTGTVTVTDSVVADNLARWNDLNGNGGGINTAGGAVTVTGSTVSGNTAMNAGGGILAGGDIDVEASTFTDNTAVFGAAMYSSFDVTSVVNSTIHANTIVGDEGGPGYGGSIQGSSIDAEIHLVHVTLTGTVGGSGVSVAPVQELTSSVLADNAEGNCFGFGGGATSNGGNLDDDDSCSLGDASDVTGDPLLGALADNGGPTATRLPQDGSPLVDSAASATCEPVDQRGISRPQDGDDDATSACDRGAVEVEGQAVEPVDPTDPTTPGSPSARPVQAAPTFTG